MAESAALTKGAADGPSWRLCLRMTQGPTPGRIWVLSERVSMVGRGVGCLIHIDDARVSRNQCEIAVEANTLRIRNLSASNPTLVNDRAIGEASLAIGDRLTIAAVEFVVDTVVVNKIEAGAYGDQTTQRLSETVHLQERFDAQAYRDDAGLTKDLHALFALVRELGREDSLDGLVERLRGHLCGRFRTHSVWIAWRARRDQTPALFPPVSPEDTAAAPMALICESCNDGIGLMTPCDASCGLAHMMAAPLIHAGASFGGVAVCREKGETPFSSSDLHYLVAVAEGSAPSIRAMERLEQLQRDSEYAGNGPPPAPNENPAIRSLETELTRAAQARGHVVLLGETGVGKELAARIIHERSVRSGGPYVVVNCPAIASELFESEMFGHELGAFTGATRRRKGLFQEAHGGTLFLDEIGDLSLANQARILRAVETGTFRSIGGEHDLYVDVRIVCATNKILPDIAQHYFRMDLYHRLAGIVIHIRPLRERKNEIAELATHFLCLAAPHALARPRGFCDDAVEKLLAYNWPGNIRELRNVVERACYTTQSEWIAGSEIHLEETPSPIEKTDPRSLDDFERAYLVEALRKHGGHVAEAAQALGMSRSTLYYKLARHSIKSKDARR